MSVASVASSRLFRHASVLVAFVTGYAPSALGANEILNSFGEAVRQVLRQPHGHYTTAPGIPFLGPHPGRDPLGRGGVWKLHPSSLAGGGHFKVATSYFNGGGHPISVSPAPGPSYPWEGSAATGGGSINTGNGDLLTNLQLVGWKSRGLGIDFTLYHNSETNYNAELGAGWTWTYDIYINPTTGASPVVHWGDGLCIPYSTSGSSFVPPAGIYDQLVKNSNGTWTVTKKNGTTYQFNTSGFCTSIADLNGNTITLTLNSGNYCTKITDPTGKSLTSNLNGSNQFTSIVDPLGRTWSFTITSGELTSVAWPSLNGTIYNDAFTYNSLNDILTHTDRRGEVWSRTYNSDGSTASATDPLSHTTTYGYTASATTITDPLSHTRTDNYSSGQLASSEDESGYSVSYTSYDANHNPTTVVDKNSNTWHFTYDSKGNTLTKTDL